MTRDPTRRREEGRRGRQRCPRDRASAPAPRSRRSDSTSAAKKTPERSATASPARPGESNRPRKKSAIPANAIPIAAASRTCRGSFTTSGEKRSTQTTPLYWRKIAFAAEVHFVAMTNVMRQRLSSRRGENPEQSRRAAGSKAEEDGGDADRKNAP